MADLTLHLQHDTQNLMVTVDQDQFTLGRAPDCNLSLSFGGISRYHARLFQSLNGGWSIEDMGSKNGTRLNHNLVASPQPLHHGDVIWLGDVQLEVVLQEVDLEPVAAEPPPFLGNNTIIHNVKELQEQWIQAELVNEEDNDPGKANARLRDLVEIAKNLSGAASIEAIFSRVQEVVFRYLQSVDRLALLVDVNGTRQLELLNVATRTAAQHQQLAHAEHWISHTICQQVFSEKVAVQTADAQEDERFEGHQSIMLKDIRSAIAVPLWDEHQVVGVLYADANFSATNWVKAGEEDLSFFSTIGNLLAANVQRWLLSQKLKSEEAMRHRLERYHSPAVVQHLIANRALSEGRIPPAEKEISILFADIVNFTALSERLSPERIAKLLNVFFEEMIQEIFAVGGTLDKYIGDCIMAFFGAPEPQRDHANRAFAAAVRMLHRLDKMNASQALEEPLQLRISINSGKAVVGDVGSSQRLDYTALGATINLASRLEALCPPGECVVSETTYKMLSHKRFLEEMGEYRLKGIERMIRVYQTKRRKTSS